MKTIRVFFFTLLALSLFALPASVFAQTGTPQAPSGNPNDYQIVSGDKVVTGGDYRLVTGQAIDGDLVIFGGNVTLDEGSAVFGTVTVMGGNANLAGLVESDVTLFGGTLNISGKVEGDVNALGGSINLLDGTVIAGDVNGLGVVINQNDNAKILGKVNTEDPGQVRLDLPSFKNFKWATNIQREDRPASIILNALLSAVLLGGLASIVMLIAPKQITRTAGTIETQPGMTALVGVLSSLAFPLAIVILVLVMITIILIPVSVLAIILLSLAFAVAAIGGWIAIGYYLGNAFTKASSLTWSPAVIAGVGTLTLTLFTRILDLVPCFGPLVSGLAWLFGIGAVLLTLFSPRTTPPQPAPVGGPLPPAFNPPAAPQAPRQEPPVPPAQ